MARKRTEDATTFDELDRMVIKELEALGQPTGQVPAPAKAPAKAPARPRAPETRRHEDKVIYAQHFTDRQKSREPDREAETDAMAAEEVEMQGDVIGLDTRRRDRARGLFSEAEENFIKSASDWLAGRPNADLILEEIWSVVVASAEAAEDRDDVDRRGHPSVGGDFDEDVTYEIGPGDAFDVEVFDPDDEFDDEPDEDLDEDDDRPRSVDDDLDDLTST